MVAICCDFSEVGTNALINEFFGKIEELEEVPEEWVELYAEKQECNDELAYNKDDQGNCEYQITNMDKKEQHDFLMKIMLFAADDNFDNFVEVLKNKYDLNGVIAILSDSVILDNNA